MPLEIPKVCIIKVKAHILEFRVRIYVVRNLIDLYFSEVNFLLCSSLLPWHLSLVFLSDFFHDSADHVLFLPCKNLRRCECIGISLCGNYHGGLSHSLLFITKNFRI